MPVKIRLQRHGRKGVPFYHIVVADARAPRDGKYIEKLGVYNPLTSPATIDLDVEKTVTWLQNGAQPTDTTRAILSFKGAMYKKHLSTGVQKGSISEEAALEKFTAWADEKQSKILSHQSGLKTNEHSELVKRMAAEQKVKENRTEINNAKKLAALEALNPPVEESHAEAEDSGSPASEAAPETDPETAP